MEPATDTSTVLPFLVIRLLNDRDSAVKNDILVLGVFWIVSSSNSSFSSKGLVSLVILPSLMLIILLEYSLARSGLWVTMITSFSLEISFRIFIIWTLVSESRAPVGSSARIISGSFTKALAIATLCIWPPDSWFGFLFMCFSKPTSFKAFIALSFLSSFEIPDRVSASSTFFKIVWCVMRL